MVENVTSRPSGSFNMGLLVTRIVLSLLTRNLRFLNALECKRFTQNGESRLIIFGTTELLLRPHRVR